MKVHFRSDWTDDQLQEKLSKVFLQADWLKEHRTVEFEILEDETAHNIFAIFDAYECDGPKTISVFRVVCTHSGSWHLPVIVLEEVFDDDEA